MTPSLLLMSIDFRFLSVCSLFPSACVCVCVLYLSMSVCVNSENFKNYAATGSIFPDVVEYFYSC